LTLLQISYINQGAGILGQKDFTGGVEMNFRNEYGEFSAQEAVDAILVILRKHGIEIDDMSFTWTLVGALFEKGVIPRQEFERIYLSLKNHEVNGGETDQNII
jgi:hypothetical protein